MDNFNVLFALMKVYNTVWNNNAMLAHARPNACDISVLLHGVGLIDCFMIVTL